MKRNIKIEGIRGFDHDFYVRACDGWDKDAEIGPNIETERR
jgi:hypothetical protein